MSVGGRTSRTMSRATSRPVAFVNGLVVFIDLVVMIYLISRKRQRELAAVQKCEAGRSAYMGPLCVLGGPR